MQVFELLSVLESEILEFAGITSGLAVKVCAQIGTITNASISGLITGPPALKQYAVEPVGVETIIPSAT